MGHANAGTLNLADPPQLFICTPKAQRSDSCKTRMANRFINGRTRVILMVYATNSTCIREPIVSDCVHLGLNTAPTLLICGGSRRSPPFTGHSFSFAIGTQWPASPKKGRSFRQHHSTVSQHLAPIPGADRTIHFRDGILLKHALSKGSVGCFHTVLCSN